MAEVQRALKLRKERQLDENMLREMEALSTPV